MTPLPAWPGRRCSCTGASASPGTTTSISSCAERKSIRFSTATAPGTVIDYSTDRIGLLEPEGRVIRGCQRPTIPETYGDYRPRCGFLSTVAPTLEWKQRTGVRVPDLAIRREKLRAYARDVYDAGYCLGPFRTERGDPNEQRILQQELGRVGVPFVLGNPLVAGALRHFGTVEQRATYLPPMARGDHIWTQLFSEPDAGSDLTGLQTRGVKRRRHLHGQRTESLEYVGPMGRLRATCWPAPSRSTEPAESRRSFWTCTSGHGRSAAQGNDRNDRFQRGVLRRGAHPGDQHDRRAG